MNEVRIASLACAGEGGVDASLERAHEMILEACRDKADLVCLPEIFAWANLDTDRKMQAAEPVDGGTIATMSELARTHRVNILTALLERDEDRVYNSSVWLDRTGRVVGVYRKVFPTDYEMREGISPGPLDFDIVRTELGPVGCCICFDINFREVQERIASQGARLVIFPTMFQGLALMQAWAKLYRMFFLSVASVPYSAAIDPLGRTIVAPWEHGSIMTAKLNLDYVVLHTDYNTEKLSEIREAYGSAIEIDYLDLESCALLRSHHPERTAEDIAQEFDLETEEAYYIRSAGMRRGVLSTCGAKSRR